MSGFSPFFSQIIFHYVYVWGRGGEMVHFLYSSIDAHLGGFHVLAIINNAAMSMGCRYLFKVMISVFFE